MDNLSTPVNKNLIVVVGLGLVGAAAAIIGFASHKKGDNQSSQINDDSVVSPPPQVDTSNDTEIMRAQEPPSLSSAQSSPKSDDETEDDTPLGGFLSTLSKNFRITRNDDVPKPQERSDESPRVTHWGRFWKKEYHDQDKAPADDIIISEESEDNVRLKVKQPLSPNVINVENVTYPSAPASQ